MQSENRGMKLLGLATGGFLSVEKMLGRRDVFRSSEGWLGGPCLKEFWKSLSWLMVWPMVD